MKKIISMALAVCMLLTMAVTYVSADALVSYTTGFETGEDISWLNSNIGSNVTMPYGSNSANTAFKLDSADSRIGTAYGTGTLNNNPVKNLMIFSFDFYADSAVWGNFGAHEDWCIQPRLYFNSKGSTFVWTTMTRQGAVEFCPMDASHRNDFSDIPYGTWARLILVYDSTTGKGDYTVVRNVDTAEAVAETIKGYDVATAGVDTSVNRFYIDCDRPSTSYIDNVNLREIPAILAQTAATPVNGATDVKTSEDVSFTFNTDIDRVQLKINGTSADFKVNGKQIAYDGELEAEKEYTVTGFVTDIYGQVLVVDHTFTTAGAAEEPPVEEETVKYDTDFETVESYGWMTIKNTDSVGEVTSDWGQVVTKAYGSDADNKALMLKTGANQYYEYGSVDTGYMGTTVADNPVTGKLVVSLDFMLDGETWANHTQDTTTMLTVRMNGTAPADVNIAQFQKSGAGHGMIFLGDASKYRQFGIIQPDTWSRLTVAYDPETGMADYALTTNVDNSNATTVYCPDFQLTPADTYTGINRIKMSMNRPNLKLFFDNLEVREQPTFLTFEDARWVDANDVTIENGVTVAAPVYKVKAANGTNAPEKVTVVLTATKAGRVEEIAMETITVPAGGEVNVSKGFADTDVSDCDVKAFLIRLQNIKPFGDTLVLEAR